MTSRLSNFLTTLVKLKANPVEVFNGVLDGADNGADNCVDISVLLVGKRGAI